MPQFKLFSNFTNIKFMLDVIYFPFPSSSFYVPRTVSLCFLQSMFLKMLRHCIALDWECIMTGILSESSVKLKSWGLFYTSLAESTNIWTMVTPVPLAKPCQTCYWGWQQRSGTGVFLAKVHQPWTGTSAMGHRLLNWTSFSTPFISIMDSAVMSD